MTTTASETPAFDLVAAAHPGVDHVHLTDLSPSAIEERFEACSPAERKRIIERGRKIVARMRAEQ